MESISSPIIFGKIQKLVFFKFIFLGTLKDALSLDHSML
jgi:hypothetical protein